MSRIGDSGETELISQLRGFLRDNTTRRPGVGTVTRVGLQAVNVQLTETGTLYRNVDVIGGVAGLTEGSTLYLLYFADNRVVGLRPGDGGISTQLQNALDTLAPADHAHPSGFGLHVILEVQPGATVQYSPDGAGLAAALAAAASGNVIYIPPFNIAGDITVPAGVKLLGLSRYESVLAGTVTGSDGAALENLTVSVAVNDSSVHSAVLGTDTGSFELHDCEVICLQAGSGNTYAVDVNGSLSISIFGCNVHGESGSGLGYGVRAQTGDFHGYLGRVYGSTNPYLQ